jgi:23S rRNA (guanine745-N1)-methyltransferase
VLDDVLPLLRCPVCSEPLSRALAGLRCPNGHMFDVARQGYINLLTTRPPAGAETPAMVAARAALHDAGHFAPLTSAIVAQLPATVGTVVDIGAGTGHYLGAVLAARPGSVGIALDVSKAAARRNARAHPAIGSVVTDVWGRLPLADACADVLLDIFAPRHGAEFHRVLRADGTLLVVTPTPEHLAELIGPLGLITVDRSKPDRLQGSLGERFEAVDTEALSYGLRLSRDDAARFVAMGPSAWHTTGEELSGRLAALAEPVAVTVSVELTRWRPRAMPGQSRGGSPR